MELLIRFSVVVNFILRRVHINKIFPLCDDKRTSSFTRVYNVSFLGRTVHLRKEDPPKGRLSESIKESLLRW